jgi:F-type H+-transporting ATPase subunit epsilon
MADAPRTGGIRCVIVTPESTILDTTVKGVMLPLDDGLRGVERGHAPFIGRLGVGEVRLSAERETGPGGSPVRSVFVEGGFVEVAHDRVTVVTQRAVPADKLDADAARGELERLRSQRAVGADAIQAKQRATETARAILATASRGGR